MPRVIKVSFQDHPVSAPNSNPATDIVKLQSDVLFSGGVTVANAIEFVGTQNAIHAIMDGNFIAVSETTASVVLSTPQGNVTMNTQLAGQDLYNAISMCTHIIDHLGIKSVTPVDRPLNFIVEEGGNPVIEEGNSDALVYIK